ncbi:hypothetical protein CTAYLR_009450 [Chrysophaeum taylorii]|uniref:Purine nucleoside permease n=1 Tax=Chrysophaeum taylorii TaxID=2483200 RepID=A0AAD7XHG5_9STRA|nr:hypothetical protein CTAYLR_009450 [Chrysophaeum taylorii]
MPSEFARWKARVPLTEVVEIPEAVEVRWNETVRILGVVTGEGPRRAAIAVTAAALSVDARDAYWIFAGIAGVDPAYGSVGSAFWAEWVVHGDAGSMFDAREIPSGFNGTTILPADRDVPFGMPKPSKSEARGMIYELPLAKWAFELTRDVELEDDDALRTLRAGYEAPAAREPPSVRLGNAASSNLFWAGVYLTEWARDWNDYWLPERAKSAGFATTAMEDSAFLEALAVSPRANVSRALVLRTASDYSAPPPADTLVGWFYSTQHLAAAEPALEAAYAVGSKFIINTLV